MYSKIQQSTSLVFIPYHKYWCSKVVLHYLQTIQTLSDLDASFCMVSTFYLFFFVALNILFS